MKNQFKTKKSKVILILSLLVAAFVALIGVFSYSGETARQSTSEEIKAQEKFQAQLLAAQKEYQLKVDSARLQAEKQLP